MSILADTTLQALIDSYGLIRSRRPINIQPASIEMHLGATYIDNVGTLDEETGAITEDPLVIQPGEFLLATTEEYVHIPNWLVGRLEGKSSWARKGLAIHVTAGFIDPGFQGEITLELVNFSKSPISLMPGTRIAQLTLLELDRPAARPYGSDGLGSHYQGQTGATASAIKTTPTR